MEVEFIDIPESIRFAVFDKVSKESAKSYNVESGSSRLSVEIPGDWQSPHKNVRSSHYYIPNAWAPIDPTRPLRVQGKDFYIDVSRDPHATELNRQDVENLIVQVYRSDNLSGRQKFYVALVSLQSFFENLVYGMLVLSGHKSRRQFEMLETHENQTKEAFAASNRAFFSTKISICPGKDNLGMDVPQTRRDEIKVIFDEIRTLRNRVVHGWGYRDVELEELRRIFEKLGEPLSHHQDDASLYSEAAFACVRLYAQSNQIKNQLSYFLEKHWVEEERRQRGVL